MSSPGRSSRRRTGTRGSRNGTSWAGASTRVAGRPSGLFLDAEPLLHPTRRVPRLARGDVLQQVPRPHRPRARVVGGVDDPVVADPPDAELVLAAVIGA